MDNLRRTHTVESRSEDFFLEHVWEQCLVLIEQELGKKVVDSWFRLLRCCAWTSGEKTLVISAPNSFVQQWLEKNYVEIIKKNATRVLNDPVLYVKFFSKKKNNEEKNIVSKGILPAIKEQKKKEPIEKKKELIFTQSFLEPRFIFDEFVTDEQNGCVVAAAKKIAYSSSFQYYPFVLYGESGMGKTHIIQAIVHEVAKKEERYLYQTAHQFINDYIRAARAKSINVLEEAIGKIDAFFIDDIHHIAKKNYTQEFFFKIISSLLQRKKKVVVTGEIMPRTMTDFIEGIRAKLDSGLVLPLVMPCKSTIKRIIKKKSTFYALKNISDEMVSLIAAREYTNVREIEGIIIKISAHQEFNPAPLSLKHMKKLMEGEGEVQLFLGDTLKKIASSIQEVCNVSFEELCTKTRKRNILFARQLAMYFMRKYTDCSFHEIGDFFNKFDHATVIHAYKKIKNIISINTDEKSINLINSLEKIIETKENKL